MITIKRLKELIADLSDDVAVVAYEGESIGLALSLGQKYGFIHTGWDSDTPADETQHDISQLVKGSEHFATLPAGAEFTSLDTCILERAVIETAVKYRTVDGASAEYLEAAAKLTTATDALIARRNHTRCESTIKKNFPIGTLLRNRCVKAAGHEGSHEVSGLKWK